MYNGGKEKQMVFDAAEISEPVQALIWLFLMMAVCLVVMAYNSFGD